MKINDDAKEITIAQVVNVTKSDSWGYNSEFLIQNLKVKKQTLMFPMIFVIDLVQ